MTSSLSGAEHFALPLQMLFTEEDLKIEPRGKVKLGFKNVGPVDQVVSVTLESLRFQIVDAKYGVFPTKQYTTRLEPGAQGEVTIIDKGKPVSNEMIKDHVDTRFSDGHLQISTGLEWGEGRTRHRWINEDLFLFGSLDTKGTEYCVVTEKPGKGRHYDTFVRMKDETPSYKELRSRIVAEKILKKKLIPPSDDSIRSVWPLPGYDMNGKSLPPGWEQRQKEEKERKEREEREQTEKEKKKKKCCTII